jgi:hypothetical protein
LLFFLFLLYARTIEGYKEAGMARTEIDSVDAETVIRRRARRVRGIRIAAGTLALTLGLALGTASPASARNLNGWVWSHSAGQTQLYTVLGDTSTYMSRARVQHLHGIGFTNTYCGAQAKVAGTLTTGAAWSRTFGYQSGCWFVMVDEVTAPGVYFRAGSAFTGQAYHDGAWSPGTVTVRP